MSKGIEAVANLSADEQKILMFFLHNNGSSSRTVGQLLGSNVTYQELASLIQAEVLPGGTAEQYRDCLLTLEAKEYLEHEAEEVYDHTTAPEAFYLTYEFLGLLDYDMAI